MMKYLRIGVSTLALSAFVLAPVLTVATADYAYAKNGNSGESGGKGGNGNGNGNGRGGGEKGADKSSNGNGHDKASRSQSASVGKSNKSNGGKNAGRSLKDDFKSLGRNIKQNGIGGLFKQQEKSKPTRSVSAAPTKSAPKDSMRPVTRAGFKEKGFMHPSNLGKMNGLINSSPNAKLAHIANGQYLKGTGPVSLGAALAVADYQSLLAGRAYADAYGVGVDEALEDALATLELDAAYGVLDENAKRPAEEQLTRASAEAIVTDPGADIETEEYKEAAAFLDAQDLVDQAETDLEDGEVARPAAEKIAAATDVVDADVAVTAAEETALTTYKGDLAPEDTEQVLDAVRQSLPQSEEEIAGALAKSETGDTELTGEADDVTTSGSSFEDDADMAEVEDKKS